MRKVLLFWLIGLMALTSLYAQTSVKFTGQIRHRLEFNGNDFNSETDLVNYNFLRTRIGAQFTASDRVSGFIQIQDSRVFGTETSTLTDGTADALDMHQAYLVVRDLFNMPLQMKLGRQEVIFGNQRLIGAVGWHNIGRSFDGVQMIYETGKGSVSFFDFKTVETFNAGDLNDFNVAGFWANLSKMHEKIHPQLFGIWDRVTNAGTLSRLTFGTQTDMTFNNISATLEAAYQTGQLSSTTDIAAYLFALNAAYKLGDGFLKSVGGGIDYLSGNDPNTSEYEAFNTLYATNHKWYGIADFFLNVPLHSFGAGLSDIKIKAVMDPTGSMKTILVFHKFMANQDITLLDGSKDTDFGNEFDLIVNRKIAEGLAFQAGLAYFMPGKVFEDYKGKDASIFAYISTAVNF
ncbi:MAG: hypothetical protein D6677_13300 [Calditrichaeota bacterium]|nr:MAG: hypothetical protein D6677_13300 [Calditrichota bacterium]